MAKKLINVMNTSFRDGFQSVYGARVNTVDFLPAVAAAAEADSDESYLQLLHALSTQPEFQIS